MTPQAALIEVIERLGATQGAAILVSDHELGLWPGAAVKAMKAQHLLTKASPASSAVCPGCERECVMPVHVLTDGVGVPKAFIVCDKRSDINRVAVRPELLTIWQCNSDAVCRFVADRLGLRSSVRRSESAALLEIGVVTGEKRSQMLCLKASGVLALVAGSNTVPLAALIGYHNGAYSLDGAIIRHLVDSPTMADNRYTPSSAKRELRKLKTQAVYESWQKEYRALTKKRQMSDVWYSQQIAKMDISNGRDAETIRKHMKK